MMMMKASGITIIKSLVDEDVVVMMMIHSSAPALMLGAFMTVRTAGRVTNSAEARVVMK